MTQATPLRLPVRQSVSTDPLTIADDHDASVQKLDIPKGAFLITPKKGDRVTIISESDLAAAKVSGNAIAPAWSDPSSVIATYALGQVLNSARSILHDIFGREAALTPAIDREPESGRPLLVFQLSVPRPKRQLRFDFLDRYVRETRIPASAPAPVLAWTYLDGDTA